MIKKVILYLLVFITSLLLSLIILFPANTLWQHFLAPKVNLAPMGIRIDKVQGTIWEGQALMYYGPIASILSWDVQAGGLFGLSLPVKLVIDSQAGEINTMLKLRPGMLSIELPKAAIQLAALNPVLKQQRLTLDGELLIKDLNIYVEDNRPVKASGLASWSGGDIAYPAGREVHQRNLPSFRADIDTKDGVIRLAIRDSQASFDVISGSLDQQGVGMMSITRRLLDLSREPWSQNSREQDVVFKVKKELF